MLLDEAAEANVSGLCEPLTLIAVECNSQFLI
jgi:hypothetical protein